MRKPRRIVAYGKCAVLLEWEQRIDLAISAGVHAYRAAAAAWPDVVDAVPAYASLLLVFGREVRDADFERLYALNPIDTAVTTGILHVLPVCYAGKFVPDLLSVSERTGLAPEAVIELHTAREYHVFQLGFRPGFAFLGELDERLALPRRDSPRQAVPAGAVAIAGRQTAIYPSASPGGWHLIGRCPLPMLRADSAPELASRLRPGDRVSFRPISPQTFTEIKLNPTVWNTEPA